MEYPIELHRNGRPLLSSSEINDSHYMYARHIPGYDWNVGESLPDFTKLKIHGGHSNKNQSFNWSKFSEPHWIRFENSKYRIDYAVISYLPQSIRYLNNFDNEIPPNLLDIEHLPSEINYSHCQLYCTQEERPPKRIRRVIRLGLKRKAEVLLEPNEDHE